MLIRLLFDSWKIVFILFCSIIAHLVVVRLQSYQILSSDWKWFFCFHAKSIVFDFNSFFISLIIVIKEDPLQQGYSRVNQNTDGTLSNSTTSTSLDTVVIDTSTDNISNSPKLQKQKTGTFSPILESEDATNPFADDIKELAIRAKKSNLKDSHITFGEDEEEVDKFDEEAFKKKREHFQKTKSRSEHKSILIRVSLHHQRVFWTSV